MKQSKHSIIRIYLREYRLIRQELELRTKYINEFSKILVKPLPKIEIKLHRIYSEIIDDMENNAKRLSKRLRLIENVFSKLHGVERKVMYLRYIEGVEWIDMPEYMMYEQRTCQSFEKKALEKIEKMNINWEEE